MNEVGTYYLGEIFGKDLKLTIPDYQRPYSWQKEQVEQLIDDLLEAQKQNKLYLIGNMILYEDKDELKIIDGQQRITTLALLFHVLGKKSNFLDNEINILSAKRLKENHKIIKNRFENFSNKDSFLKFLKEKVLITYIKTDDLDEAFVLFDAQNTRGKPLKRKDILKVHHIHPVKENRKIYAKKWEEWEKWPNNEKKEVDELDKLLYLISFIRKAIKNELEIDNLSYIDVFKELKSQVSKSKLNNYNQPAIFDRYEFDFERNRLELITKPLQKSDNYIVNGVKYLPFEIHSAISGGEMFFAYIWKYFEIYKKLLENRVFTKLDNVYGSGNNYLKTIYKTTLFFYYDKFEDEKFEEFAKRVFLLLLYFRLIKDYIRKDGVIKFKWNSKGEFNFYKEILFSYSADELIDKLDRYILFEIGISKLKVKLNELKENKNSEGKKIKARNVKQNFKNTFKDILEILKDLE